MRGLSYRRIEWKREKEVAGESGTERERVMERKRRLSGIDIEREGVIERKRV